MISQRDIGDFARFYTVTDPTKHQKGYTVYKVTATVVSRKNPEDVQEITVWKRYSDFRKLHHNLWQLHRNVCRQSELFPPFAKAKVFGRFDDSVIEERRQCSEDLLQFSANIPALYSSQHIQDFFKGGEVHDGSELIGPAEPFSDFLADSLSDCSSDVQRDNSGVEDLTITSEYGGPSSDSDLTSLAVDTDSLAELDDGMASGRTSPNQPQGGAASISSNSSSPRLPSLHDSPKSEVSRPGRRSLFSKKKIQDSKEKVKSDYLDKAGELIRVAAQKEKDQDYQAAFSFYRSGVDLLLQGVQGEPSPKRREAVKKKTAEYLMRAEQISSQHLRSNMGQGSTQTVMIGAQCCASASRGSQDSPSEDLGVYRVLGVIDKVLLVMDKRTRETFVVKGLRKSSDCARIKKTIMPRFVPHMVQLKKLVDSEDTVFLLLQHAEGGKLWSHIGKYLRNSSPDESFDIPFIQKSHTSAVHSPQYPAPHLGVCSAASSGSAPVAGPDSVAALQKDAAASPRKSKLFARLRKNVAGQSDSGATSQEECTNSYLTLCNEYEQEKVEPDELEEEEEEEVRSEQEVSLDVPTASSRSRSLLSNDSLSPVSCQELGFFTDSSDKNGQQQHDGDGQNHGEVFSAPPSLDQSKHPPMEFFRIDSKDSASEVTCLDWAEQAPAHKQPPFFFTSEALEDLPELAQEVKGHGAHLWGLDCSDKGSNESVPVISFKEAVVEDEGHPPDLLVNLPVISGVVDSQQEELESSMACLGLEAPTSPQRSIQPDVLQLPIQPEGEEEQQPSSLSATDASSSASTSFRDDCGSTFGHKDAGKVPVEPSCQNNNPSLEADLPVADSLSEECPTGDTDMISNPSEPQACATVMKSQDVDVNTSPVPNRDGEDFDQKVSRLFAELDELSLSASQARIPEAFVQCWAVEMVTALDSLHQEGIICRDLNPNNILLDHQGHVQLTYFCSWSDVEESWDKEACANMYAAPEVGSISEETDACDWWSLGAILYELLTGTSLLRCHPAGIGRHTALSIPESVSEEARSLLEQLLQYNPTERLGAGVGGVDDIRSHPFFAKVQWPK
nr:ribosomal protein S6 kinase delta-1-like isoform X1 [Nerophis lumbriciformis]